MRASLSPFPGLQVETALVYSQLRSFCRKTLFHPIDYLRVARIPIDIVYLGGVLSEIVQLPGIYGGILALVATADVAEIDLYTGRARFYKAGAAPTYLVKNRRAGYIQSDSLPAGILEGVAFESSTLTLRDGDWLALVSDGVTATGADWVKSQLEAGLDGEPAQLARSLAAAARERQLPGREDDVTVLAARLDRT